MKRFILCPFLRIESKAARYSAETPFRRSCIGLPGLKWGTRLSGTTTSAPEFGFRPGRPGLSRTVNTPMPRNSTRAPRAIAAIISSKMVLTIFSASRTRRCGFITATRWISSVFSTAAPFTNQKVASGCSSRQEHSSDIFLFEAPHCRRVRVLDFQPTR